MLHGCKQSAGDFAAGTGMNKVADEVAFLCSTRSNPCPQTSRAVGIGIARATSAAGADSLRRLRRLHSMSSGPARRTPPAYTLQGFRRGVRRRNHWFCVSRALCSGWRPLRHSAGKGDDVARRDVGDAKRRRRRHTVRQKGWERHARLLSSMAIGTLWFILPTQKGF
jgi:hypothetical protein